MSILTKQPALIVIDMLNDFLQAWAPDARQRLVRATNGLVAILRSHQRPVIWVRQEFRPDLQDAFPEMRAKGIRITIQGTPGCRIDADLAVDPSDTVIIKKRYSAFHGTTLDQVLVAFAPDGVILAASIPMPASAWRPSMPISGTGRSFWPRIASIRMIGSTTRFPCDI